MERLIQMLEKIHELLEQIYGITSNQTTVLLESGQEAIDEEAALKMMEDMVDYKEEIISKVNQLEEQFEKEYEPYKGRINEPTYVKVFKKHVQDILDMKKNISEAERNNITILNSVMNKRSRKMNINKTAQEVSAAYKKQQIKP